MLAYALLERPKFPQRQKDLTMLVLSRKTDEKIVLQVEGLPAPIEVTVVRIDRNKVRLGIEAEQGVTILRSELTQRPVRAAAKVSA